MSGCIPSMTEKRSTFIANKLTICCHRLCGEWLKPVLSANSACFWQPMVSTPADKMPNVRREDGCVHTFQPAVDRQYGDWSAARFQNLPRLQPRFQRPHRDGD